MRRIVAIVVLGLLASCGEGSSPLIGSGDAGDELDERAIAIGLLPDPDSRSLVGRFETRSELGIDKFCAIEGASGYRFGMLAVFGPESKCEGTGTAKFDGDKLSLSFSGDESCKFDAEYDGIALRFPGNVGPGCDTYCSPRASMSGTRYYLVEKGEDAARRVLGRDVKKLCG
jgi:hypothetical protein